MIRHAVKADMPAIARIFDHARAYMKATGNPTQWGDKYPLPEQLEEDLALDRLYVICDGSGTPHAVFVLALGQEPSYSHIEGKWLHERPYGTIHRLASDGVLHGCFDACVKFCLTQVPDLRADTHENNKTMQHLLTSHGFVFCGKVNLDHHDGDARRIAFQYVGQDKEGI